MEEKILRQVSSSGNGAHIFVPRKWIGERVFIVRVPQKPIKEKILSDLSEYLENVEGIYLYGSHAREEAREDSDIDLLIITSKKIKIKLEGYEIITIEKDKLSEAIKLEPLMIYSILSEAKPIINSKLLEKFIEEYKAKKRDFKEYLIETKKIIKVNKELLYSESKESIKAGEIAYSLILRLRGVYLINCLLSNKKYSNKDFLAWCGNPNEIYDAYRNYKTNSKSKTLKRNELINLTDFLDKELEKLDRLIHGKKKKTS